MLDARAHPSCISVAVSRAVGEAYAARNAAAQINCSETCFVLAFVPGDLDGRRVAAALEEALEGVPVFGCSSAGQITPHGYETDALLLLAFPKAHFRCSSILFEPLKPLSTTAIATAAQRHEKTFSHTAGWHRLGLIFADGLSKQEDVLISTLETVLDDLPLFGGSAGDALRFEDTYVLHQGRCYGNAATLLLLETDLPFRGFGFDHFLPGGTPIVITGADPDERKVFEINGAPAAQEYARLVGCAVADLSPQIFAENPLLIEYKDRHYVRAISDAGEDDALSFLAAIDDGLIMTLGQGQEIIRTLQSGLDIHDEQGRRPDFILGFDCVLRKLEIEQKQLGRAVSEVLCSAHVVGFNTYGEQHCGVHMNQTLVGVAFFGPDQRTLY
ncbi:FIST N-terminal domain-containing protein [Roseobacter sinensis]|uniref:FIST C-terminal domain-containing protein n=1 Tax=Roseobacter sinensis TaxID=2931391 RepID=A0ABT3BKF8_9RHOB|nr:FIST N-terminal domain-containing protein [Roseobacter sp. WL0113]MCV3274060.1 FIST C-terminal domain-containing protein [Roseobacter sp. WL0113]